MGIFGDSMDALNEQLLRVANDNGCEPTVKIAGFDCQLKDLPVHHIIYEIGREFSAATKRIAELEARIQKHHQWARETIGVIPGAEKFLIEPYEKRIAELEAELAKIDKFLVSTANTKWSWAKRRKEETVAEYVIRLLEDAWS